MHTIVTDTQRLRSSIDSLACRLAPHYPQALARLNERAPDWLERLKPNSLRALAFDMRTWSALGKRLRIAEPLLSGPAIRRCVDELKTVGRSKATIARLLYTVRLVRSILGVIDSEGDDLIRQIRGAHERCRTKRRCRQHEAALLGLHELRKIEMVVDAQSGVEVRTMAIAFALYDTQLPVHRLLGDRSNGRWRLPPANVSWVKRIRDGGELCVPASDGEPYQACFLTAETMAWIDRYLLLRGDDQILFTSSWGTAWDSKDWLTQLRRFARRAGLTAVPGLASCRRGAAADMLKAGMSLEDVRQAGGWGSLEPVLRMIETPAQPEPMRRLAQLQRRAKPKHFEPIHIAAVPRGLGTSYRRRRAIASDLPRTGDLFCT